MVNKPKTIQDGEPKALIPRPLELGDSLPYGAYKNDGIPDFWQALSMAITQKRKPHLHWMGLWDS